MRLLTHNYLRSNVKGYVVSLLRYAYCFLCLARLAKPAAVLGFIA